MGYYEGIPFGEKTSSVGKRNRFPSGVLVMLLVVAGLIAAVSVPFRGFLDGVVPEAQPTSAPTSQPVLVAVPTLAPTPVPPTAMPAPTLAPAPKPTPKPDRLAVANTDGQGAFIRPEPVLAGRIKAWPERAVMTVIGEAKEADGILWQNVRDPDGNEGWMPSTYLVPAPAGTPGPAPSAAR